MRNEQEILGLLPRVHWKFSGGIDLDNLKTAVTQEIIMLIVVKSPTSDGYNVYAAPQSESRNGHEQFFDELKKNGENVSPHAFVGGAYFVWSEMKQKVLCRNGSPGLGDRFKRSSKIPSDVLEAITEELKRLGFAIDVS